MGSYLTWTCDLTGNGTKVLQVWFVPGGARGIRHNVDAEQTYILVWKLCAPLCMRQNYLHYEFGPGHHFNSIMVLLAKLGRVFMPKYRRGILFRCLSKLGIVSATGIDSGFGVFSLF